jgi:hypothetical protein
MKAPLVHPGQLALAPEKPRRRHRRVRGTEPDLAHAARRLAAEDAELRAASRAQPCRCLTPWGEREESHCVRCGRDRLG